jgi:thiol-disulfide isomerase/thioredoxin
MMFISLGIGTVVAIALIVVVSVLTGSKVTSNNGLPTSDLQGHKVATFSQSGLVSGTVRAPWSQGHPSVLLFFASDCTPCRAEMPKVANYVKSHDLGRVTVLGVDAEGSRSAGQGFIRQVHATFPVVFDPNFQITAGIFQFGQLPESVFLNAKGVVEQVYFGAIPVKELSAGIASLNNA